MNTATGWKVVAVCHQPNADLPNVSFLACGCQVVTSRVDTYTVISRNSRMGSMQQQSCIIEEVEDSGLDVIKQQDHSQTAARPGAAAEPEAQQTEHCSTAEQQEAAAAAPELHAAQGDTVSSSEQHAEPDAVASSSAELSVDPQVQQLLDDCERLKQEGNAAYTRGDYDEALQLYWQVST